MSKLKNKITFMFALKMSLVHNVWSSPTFPSDFTNTNSFYFTQSVNSLFQQLDWCHLQIYLDPWSNYKEDNTLHYIFAYLHENTFSYSVHQKVRSVDKSWNNVKHDIIQKAKCYAHIFIEGQQWRSNFLFLSSLLSQESWPVNPDYIIFFAEQDLGNLKVAELSAAIRPSHYTGFCYVVLSMSEVFRINLALKTTYLVSHVDNLSIETFKYFQNLNMNHNFILSELRGNELNLLPTCDYSRASDFRSKPPTVEECIFNELGKNYNFSYRSWDGLPYAKVKRRVTMSMHYLNGEIKSDKRQIVELGFVYDQWGYLVANERLHSYDIGLIGPFDTLTWISILLSQLALSIVFVVILFHSNIHSHPFNVSEKSFRIFVCFFGSLLDQSVSTFLTRIPALGHATKLKVLWLFWCFSGFLLSQLYKGEMFSFLTTSPEPDYPRTLQSLALDNLLIYSYTGAWNVYENKVTAKYAFYLQEVMSVPNTSYPLYYNQFKDSLKFMPDWLNGMRFLTSNMFLQENMHLVNKNKTDINVGDKVPLRFASFDYLKHMFMHKQLLKLYFPNKWTSPVVPIIGFMSTMPWTVDKNIFYPIFKRGLGQIYESGLYDRWDRYQDSFNGLDSFYFVKHFIKYFGAVKDTDIKTLVPEEKWRNYYYNSLYFHESSQDTKIFVPVSIILLKIVWILVGILLGISVIIFVVELLHRSRK